VTESAEASTSTAGPEETTKAEPEAEQDPEPEPAADEPERSDRGNLVKDIGQAAGVTAEDGTQLVNFTVTDIRVDPECTEEAFLQEPPANGNFVAVDMAIETLPELAERAEYEAYVNVSEYSFSVFGPDGMRDNDVDGNGFFCLTDAEQLPPEIGPGEKVNGTVVLDTQYTEGTVVLSGDAFGVYDGAGWEWSYGE